VPSLRELADRVLGRRPVRSSGGPRLELPPVPTSEEILADLDRFYDDVDDRLPATVVSRLERIVGTIRETIPRLDQLGAGSQQAHSVVATATSYLPEAIGGYLRLPRQWADSRPVAQGKTSLMVLCDQLDLLAATMDRVLDAVLRADAAALVAHGQFLQEKFGHGSAGGDLALGDPGGPGGPGPGGAP
jgi:hypothetical protein